MVPSRCRARTDDTNRAAKIAPPHNMRSPRPSGLQLLKKRKQAHVGVAQLTTAVTRHYTVDMVCASPNTNATFECDESAKPQSHFYYLEESCDNAQQLITGSTHHMHSNFCRVMWLKNTHAKDDLQLCWRRAATIVPCIRHKFRNRSPAVDSWRT